MIRQKFFLPLLLVWMFSMSALDARGNTKCKRSYHVEVPQDQQIFYMFNSKKSEWLYPAQNSWIKTHEHKPSTIMDVEWPKWKWHTCRNGYVAIQSVRYPDYYLSGWKGYAPYVQYTLYPCHDGWAQWKPIQKKADFPPISDLSIEFQPKFIYETDDWYDGMEALIHVPPICESVFVARVLCNLNSTTMKDDKVSFKYQHGVMNGEKSTQIVEISRELMAGIDGLSATGKISATWSGEISTLMHEQYTLNYQTAVPPMKMLTFTQNEVTYGKYLVRSRNLVKSESRADAKRCGLKRG